MWTASIPVAVAVAVPVVGIRAGELLLLDLPLHHGYHFLHLLQLSFLLLESAIRVSVSIPTGNNRNTITVVHHRNRSSASCQSLRPVIFVMQILSDFPKIFHVRDEHGSQFGEVAVVAVFCLD